MPARPGIEVEPIHVPATTTWVVDRRVRPLLKAMAMMDFDLVALVRSAYLQGFCDCHDGLVHRKEGA
jgi:hypothetical protein